MSATPVQIDIPNGGEWAQVYENFQQGAFISEGNVYAMLATATSVEMFLSADKGATWTLQDEAGQPSNPSLNAGTCWFDGAKTVWVAFNIFGDAVQLQTFDTSTNTWSLPFGSAGSPLAGAVYAICLRSDSTLFVCYSSGLGSGLTASTYDTGAATWSSAVDLGEGILTLPEYSSGVTCVLPVFSPDSALQTIHIWWLTRDFSEAGEMNQGVFYVGFTLANATENFFVVPGQIGSPAPPAPQNIRVSNGPFVGPPAACGGGNVVAGIGRVYQTGANTNYATLYVSTDGGATWTENDAPNGIDPDAVHDFSDNTQFAPFSSWDGSKLYVIYAQLVTGTFPSASLRLCVTTPDFGANPDTWTWTASTIAVLTDFPGQVVNTNGFSYPKYKVGDGNVLLSTDILNSSYALNAWFVPYGAAGTGNVVGTFVGFAQAGKFSAGTK